MRVKIPKQYTCIHISIVMGWVDGLDNCSYHFNIFAAYFAFSLLVYVHMSDYFTSSGFHVMTLHIISVTAYSCTH